MSRTTAVVAVLIVGALGFVAGRQLAPDAVPALRTAGDPETQLLGVLQVPATDERESRLVGYFSERPPEDLEAVRSALRKARYDTDPTGYLLLADWWARFDPEAAFADADDWPLHDRHLGPAAVIEAWARRDARGASATVDAIRNEERRDRCLQGLIAGWQDSGQDGLVAYMEGLPQGLFQQRALEVFMARLVTREGIEAALAFAEAQRSDDRFQLQVNRRVVTAVAAHDPVRAAKWSEAHADGSTGDGVLRRAGAAWAFQDPQEAMTWAAGLRDLAGRDEAVRETFRIWLGRDRPGALAWAREQPDDGRLAGAWPLIAVATTREEGPEQGLRWLARIDDEEQRLQATGALVRMWVRTDRDAALAWLAEAEIPEEAKREILGSPLMPRAGAAARKKGRPE
jgi:hypothetical protein